MISAKSFFDIKLLCNLEIQIRISHVSVQHKTYRRSDVSNVMGRESISVPVNEIQSDDGTQQRPIYGTQRGELWTMSI